MRPRSDATTIRRLRRALGNCLTALRCQEDPKISEATRREFAADALHMLRAELAPRRRRRGR